MLLFNKYKENSYLLVCVLYVNGASKVYSNYSKKRNNKTKKHHWQLYFYDETGHIHTKRCSALKAFWVNHFTKKKWKTVHCPECTKKFISIGGISPCPFCENT